MSTDNRTSNALGVPIPVWIVKQLEKRSNELSVKNRSSTENILFRANRSSWVRMVSSVDIRKDDNKPHKKDFIKNKSDSELAKAYVLQAGISKYNTLPDGKFSYVLRSGFEETYDPLKNGVDKYGYRPMPGITSVKVTTQGRLGSIRSAEIQLKAWTKDQLDIIDTLYFKLGFTMFLEWGHTYYYDQDSTDGELKSSEELSIDPFKTGLTKEDIYNRISNNVQKSRGNYDGMLGMVTNFNFTYNQEGGYDCTIRLIALGALMSQMKINNPKELPEILESTVKQLVQTLLDVAEQQKLAELAKAQAELANGDPDYEERNKYPACVRDKKRNGTLANTRDVGDKKPNQTRAIELTTKRSAAYYFYPNGLCETIGLGSTVLKYTCDGENIVVDGVNEGIDSSNYENLVKSVNNPKEAVHFAGSQEALETKVLISKGQYNFDRSLGINKLDRPYAFIIDINSEDYIAFNKFKNVVPYDEDLTTKYKVTSKIQLPEFIVYKLAISQKLEIESSPVSSVSLLVDYVSNTNERYDPEIIIVNRPEVKYGNNVDIKFKSSTVSYITSFGALLSGDSSRDFNLFDDNYYYSIIKYYNILEYGLRQDYTTILIFDSIAKTSTGVFQSTGVSIGKIQTEKKNKIGITIKAATDITPQEAIKNKISETLKNADAIWTIVEIDGVISKINKFSYTENEQPLRIKLKTKVSVPLIVTTTTITKANTTNSTNSNTITDTTVKTENFDFDLYIVTNDIGILKTLSVEKLPFKITDSVSGQQTAENIGSAPIEPPPPPIDVNEVQKAEAARYRSAFEIMVRTIQLYSLNRALESNTKSVSKLRLLDSKVRTALTNKLFQIGLFGKSDKELGSKLNRIIKVIYGGTYDKKLPDGTYDKKSLAQLCNDYDIAIAAGAPITEDLMIVRYIFGFHFGLLGGKTTAEELLSKGLVVDYNQLMTSYVVPYEFSESIFQGATVNHPVYIPLGLVIMLLNHMCTIYDKSRPIVYIDFNHKTNICLSTPQHLSTNPYEVLIPFQGSNDDFKSILDPDTVEGTNIRAQQKLKTGENEDTEESANQHSTTPIYTPQGSSNTSDAISGGLLEFKHVSEDKKDLYRGRTLNALVSCDYILETVTRFAKNNGSGDVYLKEFLEDLLFNINKSLGDINVFRVAYDDSANAIHIVDDQSTPNLEENYPGYSSRLPLFGKQTLARSLELKTEISSKLSNMIAISSNAKEDQSNLSKSTQQFGIYSETYMDRYANAKTEYASSVVESPTNTQIKSAIQFNNSITSFYGDAIPAKDSVAAATGYYIERMSKIKGETTASKAAPMIPVSLNFSMDGMSGFGMGQSFTVDPEFLPYSYNLPNEGDDRTVAFVMIGLDHTIEANQWISNVRTNMIYGKKGADFEKDTVKKLSAGGDLRFATVAGVVGSQGTTSNTSFVASNDQAKASAESYLGRSLTDTEWSELVAATYAEASRNQTEEAYVMGVILNRVRAGNKTWGDTVQQVLRAKNQFQAITGTKQDPGPSINFVNGPSTKNADSIYGAVVNILSKVPKNYLYFTSANPKAYGPGTDITFITKLKNRGATQIGETWFSA